ncbi:MAG TPA: hypothetical protein VGE93_09630 [Bryobacteraceae bacterium]
MSKNHVRYLGGAKLVCAIALISCNTTWGANGDPENFKVELTGSAWMVNSSGQLFIEGSSFDFKNELHVEQNQPTFYGKLVVKPGRKHRIVMEGTPFRLSGFASMQQSGTYRGQQYTVNGSLKSSAELDYAFAGYQYDVWSKPMGHLGFSVGGAYLDASGTVQATSVSLLGSANFTLSKSETIGLPLAGMEFRIFPVPHHSLIEVNGEVRGMAFGDYGHFIEGGGNAGINLGHFAIEAGYRAVNADIHNTSQVRSGIFAHLHGPIYSIVFRY